MGQKGQYTITVRVETKQKLDNMLEGFGSYENKISELIKVYEHMEDLDENVQ